jgi:PBSX family phage portal protein
MTAVDTAKAKTGRVQRVLVIESPVTQAEVQKAAEERGVSHETSWVKLEGGTNNKTIKPPFNLFALTLFREKNSELGQCIEAMCTNICGFGFQLLDGQGRDKNDIPPEVEAEWEEADEFLNYGSWDAQTSQGGVRKLIREDMEGTGCAWLELIETKGGDIIGYNHVPAYQMRLSVLDKKPTTYTDTRAIGRGASRRIKEVQRRKRFRRHVQLTKKGVHAKLTWFKEMGDPRMISRDTGMVLTPEEIAEGAAIANPMVYFRLGRARSPYGLPRYIGNLFAILGGRASESINYCTIKNNNIPSMLLLVSNGQLTDGTIQRIKDFTKTVIQDSENRSRFLVIEADPDEADIGGGQVRIEAKPLAQLQTDDAMFQKYDSGNASKVRRSFRLPEVLVGLAGEYTANNVEASRRIADEQVFAPERREEDWQWNRILRRKGIRHWIYRSNGPNVTDDEDMIKVMAAAERSGAMTPRRAQTILEDIMGAGVAPLDASINPDIPFSQQMAEAVKNKAQPNEVGQQVTALKALRDRTVEVLKAQAGQGGMPAIQVSAAEGSALVSGADDWLMMDTEVDTEGRTFLLVDQGVSLAVMKLESGIAEGDAWRYPVQDLIPIAEKPWASLGAASGQLIDSAWVL